MKIAILGSGGREHALTLAISKSNKVKKFTVYQVMREHLHWLKIFL